MGRRNAKVNGMNGESAICEAIELLARLLFVKDSLLSYSTE